VIYFTYSRHHSKVQQMGGVAPKPAPTMAD